MFEKEQMEHQYIPLVGDFNNQNPEHETIHFFKNIYEQRRLTKTSQFGERVTIIPLMVVSHYQQDQLIFKAIGDNTGNIYEDRAIITFNLELTTNYIVYLLTLSFSGVYATPYDVEKFARESKKIGIFKNGLSKPYYCETCQKRFRRVGKLIRHIKAKKHKDSLIEDYPYFDWN